MKKQSNNNGVDIINQYSGFVLTNRALHSEQYNKECRQGGSRENESHCEQCFRFKCKMKGGGSQTCMGCNRSCLTVCVSKAYPSDKVCPGFYRTEEDWKADMEAPSDTEN